MHAYLLRKVARHRSRLAFKGSKRGDFETWHKEAREKFLELVADFPEPVDLDAEVIESENWDGLIRERVVFDTEEDMSLPCVVLRPEDMPADGKARAIICVHGHGPYGKEPVWGNTSDPDIAQAVKGSNYNYGEQMARRGYMTLSPDLRGFGEQRGIPIGSHMECCTSCSWLYLLGSMMGIRLLTANIWDMRVCARYLAERPEVDPDRISMMGASQGGVATTFSTAALPEIRCADIISYLNPWEDFGFKNLRVCGAQILPDVYTWFDTHDIAGLIAPRPLLVEAGEKDICFYIQDQLKSLEALRKIYEAAGVTEDLWFDVNPGGHGFAGNKAFDFFERYL